MVSCEFNICPRHNETARPCHPSGLAEKKLREPPVTYLHDVSMNTVVGFAYLPSVCGAISTHGGGTAGQSRKRRKGTRVQYPADASARLRYLGSSDIGSVPTCPRWAVSPTSWACYATAVAGASTSLRPSGIQPTRFSSSFLPWSPHTMIPDLHGGGSSARISPGPS